MTEHPFGAGKGFYIAARTGVDFLADFYQTFNLKRNISGVLPKGVSVQVRSDGNHDYVFLMNFLTSPQEITMADGGQSLLSGKEINGSLMLPALGFEILKRERRTE